jgi:hypothetical protein
MQLNSIVFPKPYATYDKSHPGLILVDSIKNGLSFIF